MCIAIFIRAQRYELTIRQGGLKKTLKLQAVPDGARRRNIRFTNQKERIMSTKTARPTFDDSKEKLAMDLRTVVSDTEELLRATADQAGEKAASLRERAQANLTVAKARLHETERAMIERTRVAAQATDEYVHENPWYAVGVAAGVGLLLGMLIGRGR